MAKFKQNLIVFMSLLLLLTAPKLTINAMGNNAGGDGSLGGGTSGVSGGASAGKCGVRMYVVNEKGLLVSKVVDLVSDYPAFDECSLTTRIGGGTVSGVDIMPAGMPKPFIHNGTFQGNGQAVKEWMIGKNTAGEQNAYTLIHDYLGEEVYNAFISISNGFYLVLEPITWHDVFLTSSADSNSQKGFYGTFYNWLEMYNQSGLPNGGFTAQLDNYILGHSLMLERDQPNLGLTLPTSDGFIDLSNLGTQGYGMHLYYNKDDGIHTWDTEKGETPAPAPKEPTGVVNIIKSYRTKISDNKYIDDGCFTRSNVASTIVIENEPQYKVIGWKVTDKTQEPDSINWNPPGKIYDQGTTEGGTTITPPATTLYVLLERTDSPILDFDGDYIVRESQITRKISLSKTDKNENILLGHSFTWNYGSLQLNCEGHEVEEDCNHTLLPGEVCHEDHSTTEYCTDWNMTDDTLSLNIKNDLWKAYPYNIAATSFWTQLVKEETTVSRESADAGSVDVEFDYDVVLHRGNDALTIAEWKNNNKAIDSLDKFNTSNKKTSTRKTVNFKDTISFAFVENSTDLITSGIGNQGCEATDEASLESNYNVDVDILYETYSGTPSLPLNTDINFSDMMTVGSSQNTVSSGRMVESGLSFSFHPYIKMRYDTIFEKNKTVFILGEYERSMKPNDYAEITWEKLKSGEHNIQLDSSQWSLHNQANQDLADFNGRLLPGGAALTLSIAKSDRQKVKVTTYQCILIDKGREQVEKTSGTSISGYTKETALQYHQDYVASVITGLDNLSVAQYQNTDYEADPFNGIHVYTESDIKELKNGNSTSSSESKYYFKLGTTEDSMDEGDLDVIESGTNTVYHTFSSDTSGNILMDGAVILTKGQGIESLSNPLARSIESRTLIVTKLIAALERNSGNDTEATWVADGHWYNEAFDGITVAISTTTLETGFFTPSQRMAIQDPKLNTISYGQNFMFRDKEGKPSYNISAFKMHNYSDAYKTENVIGMFKGKEVKMKDMDMLYTSQSYFISNITTQDLK